MTLKEIKRENKIEGVNFISVCSELILNCCEEKTVDLSLIPEDTKNIHIICRGCGDEQSFLPYTWQPIKFSLLKSPFLTRLV